MYAQHAHKLQAKPTEAAMSTILIVEDETRLAEILGEYLAREGFRTERATDGKRALELWRAARPGGVGGADHHAHGPRRRGR